MSSTSVPQIYPTYIECLNYTILCIYCHSFYLSCSILIINRLYNVTKTNCQLTLFVVSYNNLGMLDPMLQLLSLTK